MSRVKQFDAFISYSRNDQKLVEPLVQLMSLNGRRIFWDAISIQPGELWENTLEEALKNSRLVVVLWCCDTAVSDWVNREINLALKFNKKLVPVLLCSFPTSDSIGARQWIDLRRSVRHECSASHGPGPVDQDNEQLTQVVAHLPPLFLPVAGKRLWILLAAAFAMVVVFGVIFSTYTLKAPSPIPLPRPEIVPEPSASALLVFLLIGILCVARWIRKFRSLRASAYDAETEHLILQGIVSEQVHES
jgi:hypothetical protein